MCIVVDLATAAVFMAGVTGNYQSILLGGGTVGKKDDSKMSKKNFVCLNHTVRWGYLLYSKRAT